MTQDRITGKVVGHVTTNWDIDEPVVWVCDDPGIEFKIQPETWLMTLKQRGEVLEITAKHFRALHEVQEC